ncbi:redoxin domain-containing protein [Halorubrum salinum]|uniref:redoxin domain-containing protein n=1 Tax=Halorubrum salinum TaxID=767517 RepID=UPI002111F0A8|nr:redoxin domain-containing protein [Halorubrum salinum]
MVAEFTGCVYFMQIGYKSHTMRSVGNTVSDFTAEGVQNGEITDITLSEYGDGRFIVLVFYVHDFSPVCETQMCEINDSEFLTFNDNVAVLGISTDGPYSHKKFSEANSLSYPLVYDDDKAIYEMFGMIEETEEGKRKPKRGIVLIDEERTIRYWWQAEDNWDAWRIDPISELIDVLTEIIAL